MQDKTFKNVYISKLLLIMLHVPCIFSGTYVAVLSLICAENYCLIKFQENSFKKNEIEWSPFDRIGSFKLQN